MFTLAAVGDVALGRPPGASPAFDRLREADLAFANLEAPLARGGRPADKPVVLRSDPALARELAALGLDVVSFANNHALDHGVEGLYETLAAVEEAGVAVVGAGEDLEAALRCRVLSAGGARVGFMAFACTLPPGWAAGPGRPGVAPIRVEVSLAVDGAVSEEQPGTSPYVHTRAVEADAAAAEAAVAAAKDRCDVLVVSVHWGVPPGWAAPFQGALADYQRPLGRRLIDAGADLVLGHHPHTLHGVEAYGGGLICYSLGNFIFHPLAQGAPLPFGRPGPPYRLRHTMPPELAESAVFLFTRGRGGWALRVHPCVFDADGECVPARGEAARRILDRLDAMSRELGAGLRREGDAGGFP